MRPVARTPEPPEPTPVSTRRVGRAAGGEYAWPAPRSSVVEGERWPEARAFAVSDPRQLAALEWLQDFVLTIRRQRFTKRISREQLAVLAGVSYNAIKDLEHGNRWPTWQTLASCCAVLDISVSHELRRPAAAPVAEPVVSDPRRTVTSTHRPQEHRR